MCGQGQTTSPPRAEIEPAIADVRAHRAMSKIHSHEKIILFIYMITYEAKSK